MEISILARVKGRRPVNTGEIHCVFAVAVARTGCAADMNWVACKTPMPIGVGMAKRYGKKK